MNMLRIQTADGQEQEISVLSLAVQGSRLAISPNGRLALQKMTENAIHVEARNDANTLLWLSTFGPALLSVLAQHEHSLKQMAEMQNAPSSPIGSGGNSDEPTPQSTH
jgi:hypothetical protein